MNALLTALRGRGWVVKESADTVALLPDDLRSRYPVVPVAVERFLGGLEACHNAEENVWMLTPAEFRQTDAEGFRWNEYELMALDGAEGDVREQSAVRAFWDAHLPIMMAVHSDYDYVAVRLVGPGFGSVVHGSAPEWDNPSELSRSFEEFQSRFAEEAASRGPAYPYSLFL